MLVVVVGCTVVVVPGITVVVVVGRTVVVVVVGITLVVVVVVTQPPAGSKALLISMLVPEIRVKPETAVTYPFFIKVRVPLPAGESRK
jgi:hypothetical protein